VVITPFLSTHMPLIRYELGDLATVGARCSCGRSLPVLQQIVGRVSHVFRFPDGSATYRRLPAELRHGLKAGMWQIAQVAPLRIELRYEPLDWNEYGDEAGVLSFMRTLYPADCEIVAKRVEHIRLTPAGKLIEYVNEVES
jgi:phenylacetate-CoA ligase